MRPQIILIMNRMHAAFPIRILSALLIAFCLIGWSCDEPTNDRKVDPGSNLLQVLNQQDNLSLFADAINRTGFSNVIQKEHLNFTLFAPNNAAFTTYLQEAGYAALSEIPAEALTDLVGYHITFGLSLGSSLDSARLIDTFDDRRIFVFATNSSPTITLNNQAQVVETNKIANNGIIHTLDKVLTPPTRSLAGYIAFRATAEEPEFTLLNRALQHAGLIEQLSNTKNSLTLFAPTDAAFNTAGYTTVEDIENEDPAVLRNILQYHLLSRYRFTSMLPNGELTSLQGKKVTVNADNRSIKGAANNEAANLLTNEQDRLATNGILHAIDAVLLPGQ